MVYIWAIIHSGKTKLTDSTLTHAHAHTHTHTHTHTWLLSHASNRTSDYFSICKMGTGMISWAYRVWWFMVVVLIFIIILSLNLFVKWSCKGNKVFWVFTAPLRHHSTSHSLPASLGSGIAFPLPPLYSPFPSMDTALWLPPSSSWSVSFGEVHAPWLYSFLIGVLGMGLGQEGVEHVL